MESLFSYIPGNTIFHRMNPLTKLFAAFFICIISAISLSSPFIVALIVLMLAIARPIGGFSHCVKLMLAVGSVALIALLFQILCVRTGTVYWEYGWLKVTEDGVTSGVLVVLKVLCMLLPLTLMFMSTPINDLTNALVARCHLPYKYAFTITTAIRFIPVFSEEMKSIMEAQRSRGVEFDTGSIVKKIGLMIPLCVPLLVSSVKRVDAIAISAEIRGFNLRTRTSGWKQYPFKPVDAIALVGCLVLLAAMIAVSLV